MPDSVKPSRLLLRLEAEIAAAPTSAEADCKRAERAAYLARLGRFDEARAELDAIRHKYDLRPSAEMSSWLNLSEGLFSHFRDMGPGSREKILRAHALSSATNLTKLQALTAAWLAQMDYLRVDVASMVRHIAEAFRLTTPKEHSARSRACLVVAQSYHLAGRMGLALPWYGRARDHALAEGDDATISALMHNMAWLRAQQLRISGSAIFDPPRDETYALLSADSVANFDWMIGSSSLGSLVPVLRAQILTARGEYAEALALYELHLVEAICEGMGRLQADMLADQAWCRLQLGQAKLAWSDALAAEACIDAHGHFDDRAIAHDRLAQVFAACGDSNKASLHTRLCAEAWSGHASFQQQILDALETLNEM
jgi:hypothetical protein